MEEIIRSLAVHPPFDQLPPDELSRIAASVKVEHFAAGYDILLYGGSPAEFLYIIMQGSVDLLREEGGLQVFDTYGVGEVFGHVSLIRAKPPIVTVRAHEDTLAYLVPAAVFHQLRHAYPAFAQFFSVSASERLRHAIQARHAEAEPTLFQTRLRDLIRSTPLTIPPYASVRQAAGLMRDHDASCLIVETTPPGIFTDRDLRNRVVAEGVSDSTHVARVMSAPARALPADSLVFEGFLMMLEHDFHHILVTENGGEVIGVVTETDIMRQQGRSSLMLPNRLQRAHSIADLRAYTDQVTTTVGGLLNAGARVSDIGRMVAVAHDALLAQLLADAELALGPPPCPYAWLVLGSEGRYEQTLRTDQDNALVYADYAPSFAPYFASLAERVVEQLVFCGFPRCPGDIMATNQEWRQPLHVWQNYFRGWISTPDEEALLRAAIFFDYRQVYGDLDVDAVLRPLIERGRDNRVFLARLARTALRQPAPLGFFRQIVRERVGDQRDLIDLKVRGTGMVVDLARLFALEAGCSETNTLARLRLSAGQSTLSASGAEELSAAFELISLYRLRHQYQQMQRGEEPTNQLPLSRLSEWEQRELKEALLAIGRTQRSIAFVFQTGRLA